MKRKHTFGSLFGMMVFTLSLFSPNMYAKESTSKSIPGAAIFVMAIPSQMVVESKTIQSTSENVNIDIKYPEIKGLNNKKFEKIINHYLKNNSNKAKQALNKQAKAYNKQAKSEGNPTIRYELIQNYTIKETVNGFFVIELFEYIYSGGLQGNTTQKYMVIDLSSNKVVMLRELFEDESNYLEEINRAIKKEATQSQLMNYTSEEIPNVTEKTAFYINEKGDLIFIFNLSEKYSDISGILKFNVSKYELPSYILNL